MNEFPVLRVVFLVCACVCVYKNHDILMAVFCDIAQERLADRTYFFEIVHD